MREALYYQRNGRQTGCLLCPHQCQLNPDESGRCRVRRNVEGTLITDAWGRISAAHLDPVEKKPLYHFFPGREIYSIGSIGCNLRCKFCQNCQISQSSADDLPLLRRKRPEEVVADARAIPGNVGIAYTYNEPGVWIEFLLDIAREAGKQGLKNVVVSNGFLSPGPLEDLISVTDAFNIDLKAFTEDFYHKVTFSSLEAVKDSIRQIHQAGVHLEITHLVIPGLNDSEKEFSGMLEWLSTTLGKDCILHLSKYFPNHRLNHPPTPLSLLLKFFHLARQVFPYVYLGNVGFQEEGRDSFCGACGNPVIFRSGYQADPSGLDEDGNCIHCKEKIAVRR